MTSPFIGMNPYLEGSLWSDVHHELASKIRRQLVPQISPKYVALIERYVVKDTAPENDIGIMYPDVEILRRNNRAEEPMVMYGNGKSITPSDYVLQMIQPIEIKIPVVAIRDREGNQLITAIEILSPVNKRAPGLSPYLTKKRELYANDVRLLEIDFLRRGERAVAIEDTDYLVALTRAKRAETEVWTMEIGEVLPVVPIPLIENESDAYLDLQQALDEVYTEAAYQFSIDYDKTPPPPKVNSDKLQWIKERR